MAADRIAVTLMGPTASGKTELAISLSDVGPFEIISVDSALVYRGMDIGTAKPDRATLERYPHHLVDICDPADPYSAARFRQDALALMDQIFARGRIPLLVGGTMLYFRALVQGIADLPPADEEIRADIARLAERQGWPAVHAALAQVDPESAARLHPNDQARLARALEVYRASGTPLSAFHQHADDPCPYPLVQISLVPPDRALLHSRIEARFRAMVQAGLVDEVRRLYARGDLSTDLPSIKAVGYRQVWAHLAGEYTEQEMINRGIIATRQLAKRQYTWLRSWRDHHVIESPDLARVLKIPQVSSILAG